MWPAKLFFWICLTCACGCTINKSRIATEQLVASDAVDQVVTQLDFSPLGGRKVFLDTKYLSGAKLSGSPNLDYLTSSLRQQMLAYNCHLAEKLEEADVVVEARVGTLGTDSNGVAYGIPGSAAVGAATAFATGFPATTTLPELSVGNRNHQWGAAKVGLFAYDRISRRRIWQAGIYTGASQARELWVMGMGPFQRGRVYKNAHKSMNDRSLIDSNSLNGLDPLDAYGAAIDFQGGPESLSFQGSPDSSAATSGNPQPSPILPTSNTAAR